MSSLAIQAESGIGTWVGVVVEFGGSNDVWIVRSSGLFLDRD